MKNFEAFGIKVPEILLPANKNLSSWSVIACDQYTQDLSYWQKAQSSRENNPSTLDLILPEVYLESADKSERIKKIRSSMEKYLAEGVFDEAESEFIYVERTTAYGRCRKGLVAAIDLETYEWKPFSRALIRATEATIVDRIPPRKEIRKGAPLEIPHIMLLVNDSEHCLVEKAGELAKKSSPVYDGDLMVNSGHISGWAVSSDEQLDSVYASLEHLKEKNTMPDGSTFMFAVGDGNHSLATAKAVWDEYKNTPGANQNVRYALVEIVNIYDGGLTFEPIHRVLFNADIEALIKSIESALGGKCEAVADEAALENAVRNSSADFGFVYTQNSRTSYILMKTGIKELAVSRLQPALDDFIKNSSQNVTIDYIHGSDEVFRLGKEADAVTVLLPPIEKDSFFATISSTGPLPRKSFSMGEASEKRFYLECRKLFS